MKKNPISLFIRKIPVAIMLFAFLSMPVIAISKNHKPSEKKNTKKSIDFSGLNTENIRLKNKTVPLTDPVYEVIDYFETKGEFNFLPLTKPYSRITIIQLLLRLYNEQSLTVDEKEIITRYLNDLIQDTNGVEIYKQASEKTYLLAGLGAESSFRKGFGDKGSWSSTNMIQPFISGDLGKNITFTGSIAGGVEELSPDIFFQSYTTKGNVVFPFENYGYSSLPYQFGFKTNYTHYNSGWSPPMDDKWQLALLYNTEFNTSWFDGALVLNMNNQYRSWGHQKKNLLLSATARSFPGFEMKIQPFHWFRYSFLVGSLYWLPTEHAPYRMDIYGEDLGRSQKMLSCHMLEITPLPWLQLTAAGNAIWVKRFEMAYMMPFLLPSLAQDNLGDQDNPSLYFDLALQFPKLGKTWLGFYVDDFNLNNSWQMMKSVTNKYAWQLGWRTNLLSTILPGTTSTMSFTRVTPFVYTHYPESDFLGNDRPIDITYTHDGFNLGFYLPPNSGEFNWTLVNIALPDIVVTLENRLIIHGTNDLASQNIYQIYGDIYRHQKADKFSYPMLDFTHDGIYDWSVQTELNFDWKIRPFKSPHYFRLTGGIGYSKTWWESNNSNVLSPPDETLLTGNLGLKIDI